MDENECSLNEEFKNKQTCFSEKNIKIISKYTGTDDIDKLKSDNKCSNDSCLLDKLKEIPKEIKDKIELDSLKPITANFDGDHWLDNTEIDNVMHQLKLKNPGFMYSFIHMIDLEFFTPKNIDLYDYKVYNIKNINFGNEFNKPCKLDIGNCNKLTSFGVIFNTDPSYKSGQHWFSIFISTDQQDPSSPSKKCITIELFNSSGSNINNSQFNEFWIKTSLDISKKTGKNCIYKKISNIKHQKDTTGNCGAYSLFYIYSRLNGVQPDDFNNPEFVITDESMEKFRKYIYRLK
jgi:hypothetical protein